MGNPRKTEYQRPEGRLLEAARLRKGWSAAQAAEAAHISSKRWGQIENGYYTAGNTAVPVTAPAPRLALMAQAVDVTPDQLRRVGQDEAADMLEEMLTLDGQPDPEEAALEEQLAEARERADRIAQQLQARREQRHRHPSQE
jgi:transcriptional regulator with XRE-family HTH domain